MQCQKQRTKREGKQYSKAQDSFGMTTGDHRIKVDRDSKTCLTKRRGSEQNLRQKPSVWRFFLKNNKASSVLTALGVRVQKSMEQDTVRAMIPRFLKAVRKIYFLICGS